MFKLHLSCHFGTQGFLFISLLILFYICPGETNMFISCFSFLCWTIVSVTTSSVVISGPIFTLVFGSPACRDWLRLSWLCYATPEWKQHYVWVQAVYFVLFLFVAYCYWFFVCIDSNKANEVRFVGDRQSFMMIRYFHLRHQLNLSTFFHVITCL